MLSWWRSVLLIMSLVHVLSAVYSAKPPHPRPVRPSPQVSKPAVKGCRPYRVTVYSPSGMVGCIRYGRGLASEYNGTSVARNDCIYPWTHCTPITITSLQTGRSVRVTPHMFCDCYQRPGPNGETTRLVDLDPATVQALGLDPRQGIWQVEVSP